MNFKTTMSSAVNKLDFEITQSETTHEKCIERNQPAAWSGVSAVEPVSETGAQQLEVVGPEGPFSPFLHTEAALFHSHAGHCFRGTTSVQPVCGLVGSILSEDN